MIPAARWRLRLKSVEARSPPGLNFLHAAFVRLRSASTFLIQSAVNVWRLDAGACVLAAEQAELLVKTAGQAAAQAELGNYANDH